MWIAEGAVAYMAIYIYIYAVKLKAGPIVALLKLKTGQLFFFVFSLQKDEDF